MLLGFFKTKHQNALMKALNKLKQYQPGQNATATAAAAKGTTRRTHLNSTFAGSDYSPIKEINHHSYRTAREEYQSLLHLQRSQANQTPSNLQNLLGRVKVANSDHHNQSYSFREDYSAKKDLRVDYSRNYDRAYRSRVESSHYAMPDRIKTNPTVSSHAASQRDIYIRDGECHHCGSRVLSKKGSRRQFIMQKFGKI